MSAVTAFWIAGSSYLLEMSPKERRPTYVGFMNTITFPFTFLAPMVAGLLVKFISYEFVFGLCICAAALLVFEARKLEPCANGNVQASEKPDS